MKKTVRRVSAVQRSIEQVLGSEIAERLAAAVSTLEADATTGRSGYIVHGKWMVPHQEGLVQVLGTQMRCGLGNDKLPPTLEITIGDGHLTIRADTRYRTEKLPPEGLPFRRALPDKLDLAIGILRLLCDRTGGAHVGEHTLHLGVQYAHKPVLGVVIANQWYFWSMEGQHLTLSTQSLAAERKRDQHTALGAREVRRFQADRHAHEAAEWLVQRWVDSGHADISRSIVIEGLLPYEELTEAGSLRMIALRPDGSRLNHIGLARKACECFVELHGPWLAAYRPDGQLLARRKLPHPFGLENSNFSGYPGDRLHRVMLRSQSLERTSQWWHIVGMWRYRFEPPRSLMRPRPEAAAILTHHHLHGEPTFTLLLQTARGLIRTPLEPTESAVPQRRLADAAALAGPLQLVLPAALLQDLMVRAPATLYQRLLQAVDPLPQAAGLWTERSGRSLGDALVDACTALLHLVAWRLGRWRRPGKSSRHVLRALYLTHQVEELGQSLVVLRDAALVREAELAKVPERGPGLLQIRDGLLIASAGLSPQEREEAHACLKQYGLARAGCETTRSGLTFKLSGVPFADQALLLAVTHRPDSVARA